MGAGEFGDVPGPHLVRGGGDQFGFHVGGVAGVAAAFADLVRARRSRYMVETEAR